jgi:hypothetical protein
MFENLGSAVFSLQGTNFAAKALTIVEADRLEDDAVIAPT